MLILIILTINKRFTKNNSVRKHTRHKTGTHVLLGIIEPYWRPLWSPSVAKQILNDFRKAYGVTDCRALSRIRTSSHVMSYACFVCIVEGIYDFSKLISAPPGFFIQHPAL